MLDTTLLICLFLGGLAHLFATLIEESKKAGKPVSISYFFEMHPYQLGMSLTLSIAAYVMLYEIGQLNAMAALAAGYMGDSIVKKAMGRVKV